MSYTPTIWEDGVTPVNAENLNKLEQAVKANGATIDGINAAMAAGEFKGEKGDKGDKGDPGPQGEQGPQGAPGSVENIPAETWTFTLEDGSTVIKQVVVK